MFWNSIVELDALFSIIMIIIYGLISLRSKQLYLTDVFFFCRLFPLLFVFGYYLESTIENIHILDVLPNIDVLLAILLFIVMSNFHSFESVLLLIFAFVGQYYMIHSMDLLTFYIALEAQNFCFLVLCGLPQSTNAVRSGRVEISSNLTQSLRLDSNKLFASAPRGCAEHNSVEASLKYFLLSAFSSGVILFWLSAIYIQTGLSVLSFKGIYGVASDDLVTGGPLFLILCAMMFKLGAAPLHLWVVQIYSGVKRNLLLYISTAPKLSLFGFWVGSFQTIWTDYSLLLFSFFSIAIGSFGAYNQPALRSLFAYSTINEIGLLLAALETAGFSSLFQHLGIYIVSQVLLWNLSDKRLFNILAVSLAGLPPLAGFFGKAWIFWSLVERAPIHEVETTVSTNIANNLLIFALFCTGVSIVYYLRIIRLFWNPSHITCSLNFKRIIEGGDVITYGLGVARKEERVLLTSACVLLLIILPLFVMKPFIL